MNKDYERALNTAVFKSSKALGTRQLPYDLVIGDLIVCMSGTDGSVFIGWFLRVGVLTNSLVIRPFGEPFEVDIPHASAYCLDSLDKYDSLEGDQRVFYENLRVALDHPLHRSTLKLVDLFFLSKGKAKVRVERIKDGMSRFFIADLSPVPDDQTLSHQLSELRL